MTTKYPPSSRRYMRPAPKNEVHPPLPTAPGFNFSKLATIAYAMEQTVWLYTDPSIRLRAILRPGFLNPNSGAIATNDVVLAIAQDKTALLRVLRRPPCGLVLTWTL